MIDRINVYSIDYVSKCGRINIYAHYYSSSSYLLLLSSRRLVVQGLQDGGGRDAVVNVSVVFSAIVTRVVYRRSISYLTEYTGAGIREGEHCIQCSAFTTFDLGGGAFLGRDAGRPPRGFFG